MGIIVSGCLDDGETSYYVGKSNNWEVNYGRDHFIVIKYIGEEPIPEEQINYIIKHGTSSTEGNNYLDEEGRLRINMVQSWNELERKKARDFHVTIIWNGNSEEIFLEKI